MQYISKTARFSLCRRYRYSLERHWTGGEGRVLFIGLNPSTADHKKDDPSIRRCVGFAKSWGFNRMEIVNLFAYRATYQIHLLSADDPVGRLNDLWIRKAHQRSDETIACWGSTGSHMQRSIKVAKSLEGLQCLKLNKDRQPAHPLYLNVNLLPFPYEVADSRN